MIICLWISSNRVRVGARTVLSPDIDPEVRSEIRVFIQDPALVRQLFLAVAQQVEGFRELSVAEIDFRDSKGGQEAVMIEHAIFVIILAFQALLDNHLCMLVD